MRQAYRALVAAALVSLAGCINREITLEPRWAPLVRVAEVSDHLIAPGVTTTLGDSCFVGDLALWQRLYPKGSVEREACLMHERTHAVREAAHIGGLEAWVAKYLAEPSFRWKEESAGWACELTWLAQHGVRIDVEAIVDTLATLYTIAPSGPMISRDDARTWVLGILQAASLAPAPR